jgi:hypothetical protein
MTDQEFDKQIEAIDQQRRDDLITWDEGQRQEARAQDRARRRRLHRDE